MAHRTDAAMEFYCPMRHDGMLAQRQRKSARPPADVNRETGAGRRSHPGLPAGLRYPEHSGCRIPGAQTGLRNRILPPWRGQARKLSRCARLRPEGTRRYATKTRQPVPQPEGRHDGRMNHRARNIPSASPPRNAPTTHARNILASRSATASPRSLTPRTPDAGISYVAIAA